MTKPADSATKLIRDVAKGYCLDFFKPRHCFHIDVLTHLRSHRKPCLRCRARRLLSKKAKKGRSK